MRKKWILGFVSVVMAASGLGWVAAAPASAASSCTPITSDAYTYAKSACAGGDRATHTASGTGTLIFKPGGATRLDPKARPTACTIWLDTWSWVTGIHTYTVRDCLTQAKFGGQAQAASGVWNCGHGDNLAASAYARITDGYGTYNVGWTGWSPWVSC